MFSIDFEGLIQRMKGRCVRCGAYPLSIEVMFCAGEIPDHKDESMRMAVQYIIRCSSCGRQIIDRALLETFFREAQETLTQEAQQAGDLPITTILGRVENAKIIN